MVDEARLGPPSLALWERYQIEVFCKFIARLGPPSRGVLSLRRLAILIASRLFDPPGFIFTEGPLSPLSLFLFTHLLLLHLSVNLEDIPEGYQATEEKRRNEKTHFNLILIGHADSGKSTIAERILYLSGLRDDQANQNYEMEAKERSRHRRYMASRMDTNDERAKGTTVEFSRAHFEMHNRRFTLFDAPGHKSYIANMISGASLADIGVLVVSASKGEFETGFEEGGQTREHVHLAKAMGVSKLIVAVNKMDDLTVKWSKERFYEIESEILSFLNSSGYNVNTDVHFLPVSGFVGSNLKTRLDRNICGWWNGPCFFDVLGSVEVSQRDSEAPLRMPIIDKYTDIDTVVMGKVECGTIRRGDTLLVMPNKAHVEVLSINSNVSEVERAGPGENVVVKVSGIEVADVMSGFVLSSAANPIGAVFEFKAQLQILELMTDTILTAGYKAVLHIHAIVEECEIVELLEEIDINKKKVDNLKKRKSKKKPHFVKSGAVVLCRIQVSNLICIESFSDYSRLGRFILRSEGKTIAVGKITSA